MKLIVTSDQLCKIHSDTWIYWMFEGDEEPFGAGPEIDPVCRKEIGRILSAGDFGGKSDQNALLYVGEGRTSERILLIGLGKREAFNPEILRIAYAQAVMKIQALKAKRVATYLFFGEKDRNAAMLIEAAVEGMVLGQYRYLKFKTSISESLNIDSITLTDGGRLNPGILKGAVKAAEAVCSGVYLARDLSNAPANDLTPEKLASCAKKIAENRKIRCEIFDRPRMKKLGMGGLLGVAQGSHAPPKFIILEYVGAGRRDKNIVLVGKGITFDSGGISLKPADKMHEMKNDMSGAAAVIGTIKTAAETKLPLNLIGLIPATENLPGGSAYKPGDVLTAFSGKTIEIISTDAEGRVILADALSYAGRFNPAMIIDIATLTGACVVALGEQVAGLLGTDDELKRKLKKASLDTGEKIWELPLWECYRESIKSDVADLKNAGAREGGAISAASFLREFAGSHPWVHIDIAGPAWTTKEGPYCSKGGTGFGVRLLIRFLRDLSSYEEVS